MGYEILDSKDYVACLVALAREWREHFPNASAKELVALAHFKLSTQQLRARTKAAWYEKQLAERKV